MKTSCHPFLLFPPEPFHSFWGFISFFYKKTVLKPCLWQSGGYHFHLLPEVQRRPLTWGRKLPRGFQSMHSPRSLDPRLNSKSHRKQTSCHQRPPSPRNCNPMYTGFFFHESPANSGQGQQELEGHGTHLLKPTHPLQTRSGGTSLGDTTSFERMNSIFCGPHLLPESM